MSADDHYDGPGDPDGPHGEVHGLLATAFSDDMPVLNLVPTAVEGYRRQRRRTRVLGTAGGALALAGVIAAGTTLASGAGRSTGALQSAAGGSATDGSAAPVDITAACAGDYHLFGLFNGSGVYSSDQRGLAAACRRDLAGLRALTGDRTLTALTESRQQAITSHDIAADSTPPLAGTYIQPGTYDGRIGGTPYRISISVSDKSSVFSDSCTPQSCPPNRTLADGRPATELGTGSYCTLIIHYDAGHIVVVRTFLTQRTAAPTIPFDYEKLIASPGFAQLISADVGGLTQLTHPA